MLNKRGFNKKAQEFSMGALGAILLVIVVVVLIILGVSGVFGPIFDKWSLFPGSGLAGLVKACDTYAQVSSKTDYCNFKEVKVSGKTEYVNCADSRVQKDMASTTQGTFTCDADAERKECIDLLKQGVKNPTVSGARKLVCYDTSLDIGCTQDLSGVDAVSGKCTSDPQKTKPVVYNSNNAICCVTP